MLSDENMDNARQLMSVFHRFKSLRHPGHAMPGMHNADFSVLHSIDHASRDSSCGDGVKISHLSKLNRISMPAISQAINTLEEKGLVERKPGKDDRRVVCVHITKAGKKYLKDCYGQFMGYVTRIVDQLGEDDAHEFVRILNKMLDIITEMQKEGPNK